MKPILEIARALGIAEKHLTLYGRDKAKVALAALKDAGTGSVAGGAKSGAGTGKKSRLILVSALTPTPAGEGKTVTSIGLAQGLARLGKRAVLALRQPSMGPVFGRKGGAAGGGKSTVQPAREINLHFTGDFHAITAAHNLLAAAIDNQLHFKLTALAPDGVLWKRVLDANDRALRRIRLSVGAAEERAGGFDITAASEIMAVLCLAEDYDDLRARLNRLVVGFERDGTPVTAAEFRVTGAMLALLRDALLPNLVQSAEGVPAFVHGGPFANIAHGCNSVLATRMALAHGDYTVTEAGFAFDLGGEKFIDIKCRQSGLAPDAVVLVATIRALKMHGGVPLENLAAPDAGAVERGLANLARHVAAAQSFGRPVTVALNSFPTDSDAERDAVRAFCAAAGAGYARSDVFANGGEGGVELAQTVLDTLPAVTPPLEFTYPDDAPALEKIEAVATRFYGADGVVLQPEAGRKLALFENAGFGDLPVCIAKTQNSLSDDPKLLGAPRNFRITVRDFELAAGAGFLVALTGQMVRMPALPKIPSAEEIDLSADGEITGIKGA
ncbi:MAG: formate--tetrahydrofolate ligase [Puniceicoccales bacterium]|jgi:formate--tetrahydrofolate ligase|nr:formate--tetrahydrofolate ligase [Puniceicoccales bacterium]